MIACALGFIWGIFALLWASIFEPHTGVKIFLVVVNGLLLFFVGVQVGKISLIQRLKMWICRE